jgi:hypothetical protein
MAGRMKLPPESVLGTADVAALLGVTRQRVSQLKKDPTFPKAGMHYGRVGFWHRAGIRCWAAVHRSRRADVAGRFAGEMADLLVAAEENARRLDVHWIDTMAFWLAAVRGDAGPDIRDALVSMGVTEAEVEQEILRWRPSDERPKRAFRMSPHFQTLLAATDRAAEEDGRERVRPIDLYLAAIDEKVRGVSVPKPRSADHLLAAFAQRGLDIAELRRRLVDADRGAGGTFEPRRLRRRRERLRPRPAWLKLSPNPLGHDPWTRRPWGAAFARTRDGRHLEVGGENWFFLTDGDGFYVRAADGRPIGYRYRRFMKAPKRDPKPVNGFMEILPMPPVEMADWPDHRFGGEG